MKNIRTYNRRTNLSLRALSQVLEAINDLNFPVSEHTQAESTRDKTIPPAAMSDEQVVHAFSEAQRANNHCLF